MSIPSLITEKNVSLVIDGKPHIIPSSSAVYDQVVDALRDGNEERLRGLLKPKENIAASTEGRIGYDGRDLTFRGEVIHNSIKDRLHFMWERGLDFKPLMRFLDNLMDNPSYRAVNETYGFLEACNLPITGDGHFLAYKMIREDYTDIYTGRIDNSVGAAVEVSRNEVDENPNNTCSRGLHCCSKEYLGSGYSRSTNDRVVVVKVNPKDVVAVPHDYNNSKMRVCRYEVVDELDKSDVGLDSFYTSSYHVEPETVEDDLFDDLTSNVGPDEFDERYDDVLNEFNVEPPAKVPAPSPVGQPVKLNEGKVKDIKRLLAQGEMSIANIGRLYLVNESTIRKIRDGLIWSSVTV